MKTKIHYSRKSDEWRTPKFIYDQATAKGMFDPCPFGSLIDGLAIEWQKSNFVNPPYSKLLKWTKKAIIESDKGKKSVLLIPARTDTKAFRLLFDYGCEIQFITGRLHFNEGNSAPFPSMLVKLYGKKLAKTRCSLINSNEISL